MAGENDVMLDEAPDTAVGPSGVPVGPSGRPRVRIFKEDGERKSLTVSDYLGKAGAGAQVQSNAPATGSDDAIADERDLVGAMMHRSKKRAVASAKQKLNDMVTPAGLAPPPGVGSAPSPSGGSGDGSDGPGEPAAAIPEAASSSIMSTVGAVAKDIGRGATESGRQMVGGARDAAQAAIDLGDWVADKMEEIAPLGGYSFFNEKGEFAPGRIPAGDPRLAADKTGGKLPEVKEATTVTGGLVRGVAQFLTGFVSAGGVMGSAVKSVPLARAAIQGGLADFVAFQPDQQRLSNLIQEHTPLANPVNAYFASKAGDGQAEGRFKNAIEGLGLGILTEGLIRGVRYIRDAKRAAAAGDPAQAAARTAGEPRQAQPLTLLGDEMAPLLEQGPPIGKTAVRTPQGREMAYPDFGVPDDVVVKAVVNDARPSTARSFQTFTDGQRGVSVEQLHARAIALQGELNAAAREIEGAQGVAFVDPGPKALEKVKEKIGRKGYDGPHQITDAARGGFVVESPAQADAIAASLAKRFDVLDEGWSVSPLGYTDRKVLVRGVDGTVGEIQIIPAPMYEAKSKLGGQDLYTKERGLQAGPEKLALRQQQTELYSAASERFGDDWAGIFETSRGPNSSSNLERHAASDKTAAVLDTSELSTAVQGADGLSTAKADPSGVNTAGRQSQLQNVKGIDDNMGALGASVKDALTPLSEGNKGVYVNFARIESADDVKAIIGKTAEAFKDDIDAARRGIRTHAETSASADGVDAWKALLDRRQGEAMNAETSLAARRLWEASAAKLIEVANVAKDAATPENLFQFRKMMGIHATIQQEVIAARTETARALNAWKIPAGGGAERLRSIENVLQTNGGDALAADLAAKVAALGKVPNGMSSLADIVEKSALTKTREVATEVWINAILSNPKTHIVNMIGNAGATGVEMVERYASGVYSRAIGSGEIQVGEAAAKNYAVTQGIREGWSLFKTALRTGESSFGVESTKVADAGFARAISADNLKASGWLGQAIDGMGFVANLPTRFLNAEDDFFKAVAYRMEVNAQAFRQASREVADGALDAKDLNKRLADLAANPPENIRLGAGDVARYQTFTSQPGAIVQNLGKMERALADHSDGGQLGAFAMRLLIPFRNTPANLVKYSFERTPAAPLMSRYREAIQRGGADADIARTRMALGTMTTLTLMDFALDGHITGNGPSGDDQRGNKQTMERSGWQPYSIKVGDRYFSYKRTDPFGMSIGMAADLAEIINNANIDEDKAQSIGQATALMSATFGNLLLSKNWMSGMSDFVDTLRNPNKASNMASRIAAGFVIPAVVGEVRRQADPYMRYTEGFIGDLKNRIPGLSSDLPMARDMWGRPKTFQSGMGTAYDAISPIASRKVDQQPIDKEAIANDFNLSMPGWTISYGNHLTVSLKNRPEAYSRLLEIRGQQKPSEMAYQGKDTERLLRKYDDRSLLDLLNDIVTDHDPLNDQYVAGSSGRNGGKDQMISKVVADYGRAARMSLLAEMHEIKTVVDRKKAKQAAQK